MEPRKDTVWQSEQLTRTYLKGVRAAIPFAGEQIDVMLRLIGATGRKIGRVLDLGCGDGVLAEAVSVHFPGVELVLLDFSEPMLIAARQRFQGRQAPVTFLQVDYGQRDWTQAVANSAPFDAVISGYSIHHQPDARKREIYAEVFNFLTSGAMFVNVEHVASATPWVNALSDELFIDNLCRAQPGASREDVASSYYYRADREANILAPVEIQCEWLRQIGFIDVDCYMKAFEVAVFGGRKPNTDGTIGHVLASN